MFLLLAVDNSNNRSHISIDTRPMTSNNTVELSDGGIGWALGGEVELPVLSALRFLPLLPILPTTVTTILVLFQRVVFTVLQTVLCLPVPAQVLDLHLPFRICLKLR